MTFGWHQARAPEDGSHKAQKNGDCDLYIILNFNYFKPLVFKKKKKKYY